MRQTLRRNSQIILIGVLAAFLIQMPARIAHAGFDTTDALVTVGISTGAGAILGLSTVSFYSEPSKHFGNILIGAGLGLIVGVGISAYMVAAGTEEEEIDPEELLIDTKKKEMKEDADKAGKELKKQKDKDSRIWKSPRRHVIASNYYPHFMRYSSGPSTYTTLTAYANHERLFAMNVLKLRF